MAAGTAVLGLVGVGQFVLGRLLTDSTHATQYLWWVPALWTMAGVWGLLAVSAVFGRWSRRSRRSVLRPALLAGCVGMTLWVVLGEWHMQRAVTHRVLGSPQAPRAETLRLMHWNLSATYRAGVADELVAAESPDIVAVVNARYDKHRRELVRSLGESMAPGDEQIRLDGRVRSFSEPGHLFSSGMAIIASRQRILRAGVVNLEHLEGTDPEWRSSWDPGFVVWVEIDPGERFASLGRPIVVWVVDFPSDPMLWRMRVAESARDAVSAWNDRAVVCDEEGRWVFEPEPGPVPPPDVVMGDFNAPRGSASVERITPGMADAFSAVGVGRARSWHPRGLGQVSNSWAGWLARRVVWTLEPLADWHIDLTRVGGAWRASKYRLIPVEGMPHAAQVVEVTPDR